MKLSPSDLLNMKRYMLRKLVNQNTWGAKHTSDENLSKGMPKHLRGFAKDVVKELIKTGVLLSHPTGYGLQVSLNPTKAKEIKGLLNINF